MIKFKDAVNWFYIIVLPIFLIGPTLCHADQSFEIQENAAEGTQIGQLITAPAHTLSILRNTDPDGDGNDAFRLEGSNLLVNDSGDLDYEGIVEQKTVSADISAGVFHSLALKDDRTVVGWGSNEHGQINVPGNLKDVIAIDAGVFHNLALKSDGTVVAWGINDLGQCDVPEGLNSVIAIAAGGGHSVALKEDGTVIVWGDNWYGQTDIPDGLNNVTAIAAGDDHILALKADGTVVGWGSNEFGQSLITSSRKNKIEEGGGAIQIGGGATHSVALRADGTVLHWGITIASDNLYPPEDLRNSGNVISIDIGNRHNLALKGDGTVVAWGRNTSGQSNVPNGLKDVIAIAAGFQHSVALKEDGTIVTWGDNGFGQTNAPGGLGTGIKIRSLEIVTRSTNDISSTDSTIQIILTDDRGEDMDNDGLTQAEEEDIHNTSDTLYDTDGDGHSDGEEVNSGTDPTNPQSIPVEQIKILDFTVDGRPGPLQSFTLTFTSKNNRNYRIERSKDLISWEPIIGNVKGSDGTTQFTGTDPVTNSHQFFYRVKEAKN